MNPITRLADRATSLTAGLVLATLNPRDVAGIDGLAVEDWSS